MITLKPYHIVADGFSRIRVRSYNPEKFPVNPEEQRFLDDFVAKQTEAAQKKGGRFFDGDMVGVRMDSLAADGPELSFDAQVMKYSQHAARFRGNPTSPMQAVYVNALCITRDGKLVFGRSQATEAQWMGRFGIPAGGVLVGPDGYVSLGNEIGAECGEEVGLVPEYHLAERMIPGWIGGMSRREKNYHLTTSFVAPLRLTAKEYEEYFADWKAAQDKLREHTAQRSEKIPKVEFAQLVFLPNDAKKLVPIIEEQDAKGNDAQIMGKSLDVVEEWARTYKCDPEGLKESKKDGAEVYLPQPEISS